MSATVQTNGKKSSNSSIVNTPASTPVTNGNSHTISQTSPPPPNNNAPKYGTLVPNRIFVGGISANTTEGELLQLFSSYGTVKAAKIIQDRAGVSKGYGFITFESEDDAKRPLQDAENIMLRERKLNIAPAIKKQPFTRGFEGSSPPAVTPANAPYYFPPTAGVPYFQGGVAYYAQPPPSAPGDPNSQPPNVYPAPPVYPAQTGPPQPPTYPSMMFPQTIYMPPQFQMQLPYEFNIYPNNGTAGGGGQFMVGGGSHLQNGPGSGSNGNGSGTTSATQQQLQNGGSHMPPPSSPSRPPHPCYNPQLHFNPDAVYYNMPVYGPPMEGAPIYADGGLDVITTTNGCSYNEVSWLDTLNPPHSRVNPDGSITENGDEMTQGPYTLVEQLPLSSLSPQQQQQQQNASAPQSLQDIDHSYNTDQFEPQQTESPPLPPPSSQQNAAATAAATTPPVNNTDVAVDTNRPQSKTPVVSLLSMEHQEKDFISLQGGRRVKPAVVSQPPPAALSFPPFSLQGYPHNPVPPPPPVQHLYHPHHHHPNPYMASNSSMNYRNNAPLVRSQFANNYHKSGNHNKETFNGYHQPHSWRKPKNNYYSSTSRNNNHSSRSSQRTDSNSSANATTPVDENRNVEEKHASFIVPTIATVTATASPTTATVHYSNSSVCNSVPKQQYYNNTSFSSRRSVALKEQQSIDNNNSHTSYARNNHRNNTFVVLPSQQMRNNHPSNFVLQSGGKRNKKVMRRNNSSSTHGNVGAGSSAVPLSEIGAGDAPIPIEIDDTSKKLDGLKL